MSRPDRTQALGEVLIAFGLVVYIVSILLEIANGTFPGIIIAAVGAAILAYEKYYRDNNNNSL